MQTQPTLSMPTLLLMISFASVNAVLFTPALPAIAAFFDVSNGNAQQTITWFLIGYALGQLVYGPIANRFGRKPALYAGIILQIISSLLCASAGPLHSFALLVLGRFMLALGAGVGLKMTFTLVNECYETKKAAQKISYLIIAFAITPGLSVALGGMLNTQFGWTSCFYALSVYGVLLLALCLRLPETQHQRDLHSLELSHLINGYRIPFKSMSLVTSSLIMGSATAFVYVFAALAPFIAIDTYSMTSANYGLANLLPPIRMILGSLASARFAKFFSAQSVIRSGIIICSIGVLIMSITIQLQLNILLSLFTPMILIYFGLSILISNASALAMNSLSDKAHASAVMNFINMGYATVIVLSLSFFTQTSWLMPITYLIISSIMVAIYFLFIRNPQQKNSAPG